MADLASQLGLAKPWERLAEGITAICDTQAMRDGDPATISAMRIFQALGVAAKRKDATILAEWERATLRYMKDNALDEYLELPLPPRKGVDRHLVLDALKARIAKLLTEQEATAIEERMSPDAFCITVAVWIGFAFPSIPERVDDQSRPSNPAPARLLEYMREHRRLDEIDPEVILLDGLEAAGISRREGHNWLKGTK